jgi:hypothetical protein
MTECTFKPNTNTDGKRKKIISDMLHHLDENGTTNNFEGRSNHNLMWREEGVSLRQTSNDEKENFYNFPQQIQMDPAYY